MLHPGDYTLKVSAEGFQARQQSISLQPDDSKAQVASPALQLSLPVLNLRTDCLAVCEPPASLSGLVTDVSGAVVANAIVRLEWPQNKTTLEATTGDDGRYFLYAHPGNYTVTVHFPGFVVPKQALQLDSDTPRELIVNVQLNVSGGSEVRIEPGSVPSREVTILPGSTSNQTLPLRPLPPLQLRSGRLPKPAQ